jgi:hypothetical protein
MWSFNMVRTSNSISALKKKLAIIERHIKVSRANGFGAKKLMDARSQYIEILRKRNAYHKE